MIVLCKNCNKEFYAKKSDVEKRGKKFCSRACYSVMANKIPNSGRLIIGHKKQGLGDKNSNWKGDGVGYSALHAWIKTRLKKVDLCQRCDEKKSFDLANKSGLYLRELSDWWWLCRHCHMEIDGRLKLFLLNRNNAKK